MNDLQDQTEADDGQSRLNALLGYEHMLLPAMLRALAAERDDAVAINALTHAAAALEKLPKMRDRIERLRGALKTASGWCFDATDCRDIDCPDEWLKRADLLLEWAGDMEPNVQGNRRCAALSRSVRLTAGLGSKWIIRATEAGQP